LWVHYVHPQHCCGFICASTASCVPTVSCMTSAGRSWTYCNHHAWRTCCHRCNAASLLGLAVKPLPSCDRCTAAVAVYAGRNWISIPAIMYGIRTATNAMQLPIHCCCRHVCRPQLDPHPRHHVLANILEQRSLFLRLWRNEGLKALMLWLDP
jgi:hypothetical protein